MAAMTKRGGLSDEALAVLKERGQPMTTGQIWTAIEQRGNLEAGGDTPIASLATTLLRCSLGQAVTKRRRERPFYKAAPATFGLVEWLPEAEKAELERKERALASGEDAWDASIAKLREALDRAQPTEGFQRIVGARAEVLARFSPIFSRAHVAQLDADEVREFLRFSNNRHWESLQRLAPITRDMPALRDALAALFDDERVLDERVDYAHNRVSRLAQAVITPILLVFDPNSYGVWNSVSVAGLEQFGLLPTFPSRSTLGERYAIVNEVLLQVSAELEIDLWTLDALWWSVVARRQPPAGPKPDPGPATKGHIWIEITSLQDGHGGEGWELGKCLWSPVRNAAGSLMYELMREPMVGDTVIHFVAPLEGGGRRIAGTSTVAARCVERTDQPPTAGNWSEMGPFYRVELDKYRPFPDAPGVDVLVERGRDLLRQEAEAERYYPYSRYGDSVRLAQGRYLARCTPALYELVSEVVGGGHPVVTAEANLGSIVREFAMAVRDAGVSFGARHDEVIRNFVCSLAAKRFVILTGLSGSGKTQLATKFGQWLGDGRYELVAVRPDWTGPESLLGYEDALLPPAADGRRAWNVPRTLEFILTAARDPTNPYLLILDEMNLAHVERYFADILSGIESEERILPDLRDEAGVWRPSKRGDRLALPENLLIAGTINIDETTYMFSPKVLDRANTIEFRVETDELPIDASAVRRPDRVTPGRAPLVAGFLEIATSDEWQADHPPEFDDTLLNELRVLHALLRASNDEFGHRTLYESLRLAALLADATETSLNDALDVVVLQKILPRLHGSRRRLERVLHTVGRFCVDASDETTDPFQSSVRTRLPRSFAKLARMNEALRANQYASFSD